MPIEGHEITITAGVAHPTNGDGGAITLHLDEDTEVRRLCIKAFDQMPPGKERDDVIVLGLNAGFVIRMLENHPVDTEVGKTAASIIKALTRGVP